MDSLDTDITLFWDKCHSINKVDSLSGCQYDETISSLKLQPYIKPNARVLEVGVGLGYVTKGLYENKMIVSCLEISNVGIVRVREYCENTYGVDELEKIPSDYFDLIICTNVVQHVSTDLLIEELRHCIRSLKVGGVFALEFVSADTVEDTGINPSLGAIKGGGCCRSPQYLEKIINDLGGECEMVVDHKCDIGGVTGCHVFHIRRTNNV